MKKLIACLLALGIVGFVAGCSKYIKPSDKPAYDAACNALAAAEAEIKLTETSESRKDMKEVFSDAKAKLALANEYLNKDSYAKSEIEAKKASVLAKEVREIPNMVNTMIADTEKSLQFAAEVGLDKTYGKKLKEIKDNLWEAKNNVRLKRYKLAKEMAVQAYDGIRKAIDDVEKANDAMTRAKTAIIDAKDAGADTTVADLFKSAEEAVATAKTEMDNANFVKSKEAAEKACSLAKEAAEKAKTATSK